MERWLVLYDQDCAFCRWGVDVLLRLDRHARLRAVPIQGPDGDRALSSLPADARLETWHVRSPDGQVYSAGHAVPVLLRLLPGGRPLAIVAERFPGAVERLYRLIARHRGRLARLLGGRARAVDPSVRHRGR